MGYIADMDSIYMLAFYAYAIRNNIYTMDV